MRPAVLFSLFADVDALASVGAKTKEALARLSCSRVVDLFWHVPAGTVERRWLQNIRAAQEGEIVTVQLTVDTHFPPAGDRQHSRKHPYRIRCYTETGFLMLVFFNHYSHYMIQNLLSGKNYVVSGKVEWFNNEIQIVHPDYAVTPDKADTIPRVEAVYPLTYALTSRQLARIIQTALQKAPQLPEWLRPETVQLHQWQGWRDALLAAHNPANPHYHSSRKRLAYDELLANQLALSLTRHFVHKLPGESFKGDGNLRRSMLANIGFKLTEWQQKALEEISHDQESPSRMMRLLQGDVGSGKTVVALLAMLKVVECGKQAALMAPTEILGQQHFAWMVKACAGLGINIAFLSGSTRSKERQTTLGQLAGGAVDIIIGTHALFQEEVMFHDLGLAVIDEQHRFGVEQRMRLADKSRHADILLMTATPIPRTLTLTAYGDMDISYLKGKPAGRLPITTRTIPLSRLDEIIDSLKRATESGNRAYWICPLIEEAEGKEEKEHLKADLAAAEARFLQFQGIFEGRVGLVHGRMKAAEKDAVMLEFAEGRLDVLVATTVIEVGIDVPEASIIIIEHAERFGLSQLHQLRGRVGRGDKASSCLLLYGVPLGEISKARLSIMRESEDGFRIAEEDLRLRGGGEVLGTKQSGLPGFKLANMEEDGDLLAAAREEVMEIMATDPELTTERGLALKNLLYLFEYDSQVKYVRSG